MAYSDDSPSVRISYTYQLTSTERNRPIFDNGKGSCELVGFPESITQRVIQAFQPDSYGRGVHILIKVLIRSESHPKGRRFEQSGSCPATDIALRAATHSICIEIEKDVKLWSRDNLRTRNLSRKEATYRIREGAERFYRYGKKGLAAANAFMPPAQDMGPDRIARRREAVQAFKREQIARRNGSNGDGMPIFVSPKQDTISELLRAGIELFASESGPSEGATQIKDALEGLGGIDGLKEKIAPFLPTVMEALSEAGIELEPMGLDESPKKEPENVSD